MRLFVLRHGQAEAYCADDAGRQLVEAGRAEVSAVVRQSMADLMAVQEVWVSPLVRAQQTAGLAIDVIGPRPLRTTDLLIPEADPRLLLDNFQLPNLNTLLLVSHQPLVGRLLDLACGAAPGLSAMSTGELACIDFSFPAAGLGQLVWRRRANGS